MVLIIRFRIGAFITTSNKRMYGRKGEAMISSPVDE